MSSSIRNLDLLSEAVATCIKAIGDAPHNIGFLNRAEKDDNKDGYVDVYIFARSKERSITVPKMKLGISEMMGVFHAQSEAELNSLASIHTEASNEDSSVEEKSVMEQVLADVSFDNKEELWESIVTNLLILENKT